MDSTAMQPPAIPDTSLDADEATQQATQSTQPYSQHDAYQVNNHIWGFLLPCSQRLNQIDFFKINPTVTLGRSLDNQVTLPGMRISNKHCIIRWDGTQEGTPVVVRDTSSNGTFINGQKIGKGQSMLLHNGNEIAFGTPQPQPQDSGIEDYRFVFRFTAAGPAKEGLWAHYDVSHELGTGSFATVHKALNRRTGQWVAVKMIRSNKLASPNGNNDNGHSVNANANARAISFAREIKILQDLQHHNICTLIESFWTESEITLVLELIDGGDLLEYILKRDGLDETYARYITYQLCDALAYIHGQGVAHRDLKPENVLLTKDDPPIVKVADFGLAKYIDSLTMLKTMCGTPSYLAPEVVQNNENGYGYVVDSWSVGVIVFSMLTVSSPFVENDEMDIKTRIETRTTEWSLLTNKNLSSDVEDFLRRLLDENPKTRMTAAVALTHPWLADTGDELKVIRDAQVTQRSSAATDPAPQPQHIVIDASMAEESMLSLGSADVSMGAITTPTPTPVGPALPQDMSLDNQEVGGAPGAYSQVTSPSQNPTYRMPGAFHVNTHRNGRAGLQRRSQVIADAEANGHRLPEPSAEMYAQAASQNLNASNQLKRKAESSARKPDSSLVPLPEEGRDQEDEAMEAASEQEQQQQPAVRRSKRGRKSSEPETPQRAGAGRRRAASKSKRGRGSGRAGIEFIGEEDEAMGESPVRESGVRRSPRNLNGGASRSLSRGGRR